MTQVLDIANKKVQYLEMGINLSQISYGYLYADSVMSDPIVVKFFSVHCTDTIPVDTLRDTTFMKILSTGTGMNPDTSKFTSNLLIKVIGNNASGSLYTRNFSQIPDTLPVAGTMIGVQNGSGGFTLYSKIPSITQYTIIMKFTPDFYDGCISRTYSGVQNTIAHLAILEPINKDPPARVFMK